MDLYIPHATQPKLIQDGFSSSLTYCLEHFPAVGFQFGQKG